MELLNLILTNPWFEYALYGLSGSGFLAHAAAITPTKKDDKAIGIIGSFLQLMAGNYGNAKNSK